MNKRRKYRFLSVLLICLIALQGCTRERIIDKISIIHVFGLDLADNDELLGTALIPDYTMSQGDEQIQYLEEQVPTSVLFVPEMATHTSTRIELAKIRVLVFGKEYAESGVEDMVDRFILTPELGTNIQIAVSTHTAKETLSTFMNEKSLTLADRLEQNMVGHHLPNTNLHIFLNHFYGEGMDAYVPMITIDENDRVQVEGMGIFQEDKLKLQLDKKQTSLFSYLEDRRSQASYLIKLDEAGEDRRENVVVRGFRSKSKWDWDQKKRELNLDLSLKMTLIQYPKRYNLEKESDVSKIKRKVVESLEEEIRGLLSTLQENGVDPLGIGNIVRSKDRHWEKKSFYEEYPEIPIHVNVDLEIIHSGLEG